MGWETRSAGLRRMPVWPVAAPVGRDRGAIALEVRRIAHSTGAFPLRGQAGLSQATRPLGDGQSWWSGVS
jgi:hypothetical protein